MDDWWKEVTTVDMTSMRSSEPPKESIQPKLMQNGVHSFEITVGSFAKLFSRERVAVL